MRRELIAFVVGLALLTAGLALTLLRHPIAVARSNRPPGVPEQSVANAVHGGRYCQAGELLPHSISAVRVWLAASSGPAVTLAIFSRGRRITGGQHESGWVGGEVTIPVEPVSADIPDTTVCVSFKLKDETVILQGNSTPPKLAALDGSRPISGRLWIDYLRPGKHSWASLIPTVVHHMGLSRGTSNAAIPYIALLLLGILVTALSTAIVRTR